MFYPYIAKTLYLKEHFYFKKDHFYFLLHDLPHPTVVKLLHTCSYNCCSIVPSVLHFVFIFIMLTFRNIFLFSLHRILYHVLLTAACDCHIHGSLNQSCHSMTGQCFCKPGVVGLKCDQCLVSFAFETHLLNISKKIES